MSGELSSEFLQQHFSSRKNEHWKYADLTFLQKKNYALAAPANGKDLIDVIQKKRLPESLLLVCVNGFFVPSLSDVARLPKEMIVSDSNQPPFLFTDVNEKKYPFASLNLANAANGLVIKLSTNTRPAVPLHLLSISLEQTDEWIAHTRHVLMLEKNTSLTVLEENIALSDQSYFMNKMTAIFLDEEAELNYFKLQNESKNAVHTAYTVLRQEKNSRSELVNISSGGFFSRDDVVVQLQGPGADCYISGFYRLRNKNQYIDNHVDIHHKAAHSRSEMLYKGIVENTSRAVFNGRLLVEKQAQKITAYQANHHLLLSREAEAYSKPQLEIYADDVRCKHGATTGRLDQDALFYLRSRGINHAQAVNILLEGFAREIIERIAHEKIKQRARELI